MWPLFKQVTLSFQMIHFLLKVFVKYPKGFKNHDNIVSNNNNNDDSNLAIQENCDDIELNENDVNIMMLI